MRSAGFISFSTAVASVGLVTVLVAQQAPATKPASPATAKPAPVAATTPAVSHPAASSKSVASTSASALSVTDANALVKKYCIGCHNDRNKDRTASLTLASFDMAKLGEH